MNPVPTPPSPDDLDLNFDAEGSEDNTIRPCPPERRASLEAYREQVRRWWRPEGILDEQGNIQPHCIDIDFDGPGDNTIRPCPPERRASLEAYREKLRQWGALKDPAAEKSPDGDSSNDQGTA